MGASSGDPVNLATLEEEYHPTADLTVYNPVGPSVTFSRLYNSLSFGTSSGFGDGWSHSYRFGMTGPLAIVGGPNAVTPNASANLTALYMPNGSKISITPPSTPTSANPHVTCTVQAGVALLATWNWGGSDSASYFILTFPDRTQWITSGQQSGKYNYSIVQIVDRNGNAINLNYTTAAGDGNNYLSNIKDKNNRTLLTLNYTSVTPGRDGSAYALTSVADCYGRSVYYHVNTTIHQLDQVSQIVATGTTNPPARYNYGYANYPNTYNDVGGTVSALHTIAVPSPTGSGTATATINYDNTTNYVSSIVDANGNSRSYRIVDGNHTQVIVKDSLGNIVYRYMSAFDANMSATEMTNGAVDVNGNNTTYIISKMFADPNDPYRPSQVLDGNGIAVGGANGKGTTSYTWDKYGNRLTKTSPRGTVTTNTPNYTNFALGEITKIQIGNKTPITLSYYEPSGLIQSVTYPKPGDVSGATVTGNFSYDALGNLTQESGPGNNATSTETVSFNYTSDPQYNYTQAAAIHQPLTRTDTLGHVSHFRFDVRGNKTAEIDALGNKTDIVYNLADQMTSLTFPVTGMTGGGRAQVGYVYLYPGGPQSQETQTNESNAQVFQVSHGYGAEGESLSRSGSTQPFTATYDALYRMTSTSDGNNHITRYAFTQAGYFGQVSYPNANAGTGYDIISLTSFDNNGNVLKRVDGRGVVTNFVYNDPESKLTDLQYPVTPTVNVHVGYDEYGRRQSMTDGSGSQSWSYDFSDSLLTATTTYTGLPAQTLTYAYYLDGSNQSLTLPVGTSFSYGYDAAGRETSLQNPSGQTWNWSYLNNDWLSQQSDAGRVTVGYTRNARGILTNLANTRTSGGSTLSSYSVSGFTPAGSIGQVVSAIPAATAMGGTTNYVQDTRLEMTNESSTAGGGYTLACAYDAAENPTTSRGVTQTFNADNQNKANSYDGAGNPTTNKGTALSFDAENRMTGYGSALTAAYRGDNLRAWKNTASGKTYFVYNGDTPVLELNGTGATVAVTTFGPTGVLARTTATRTLLYTSDYLGNASQQLDASTGTVVASYAFDSFGGRQFSSSDPIATSDPYSGFGGTLGYYTDSETGLQLLSHRYYDSAAGRFLNRDPMDTGGGINIYGYVSNNPLDLCDPTGYDAGGGGGGGAGGGHLGVPPPVGRGPFPGLIGIGGPGAAAGGLGCAMGAVGTLLTAIINGDVNMSLLCPLAMSCGMGALCALLGAGVGGAIGGCIVGGICGGVSAALGQMCALANCNPPSSENSACQIIMGIISGCIGGFCGPFCGWIGAAIGGALGAVCNTWAK